jgi:hypothetical protein
MPLLWLLTKFADPILKGIAITAVAWIGLEAAGYSLLDVADCIGIVDAIPFGSQFVGSCPV